MARSSDVGRWHWTHCAVFVGNRAMNCSSTTRSMIWSTSLSPANSHLRHASRMLVSHHEGPAVFPQLQRSEALAMLLGGSGRPAGGWLASGRRRPGGSELAAAAPPTAPPRTAVEWGALASSSGATHMPPRSSRRGRETPPGHLRSHLLQRHVGGQGWGWWNPLSPNLPVHPAPEQLAVLLLVLDEGAETAFLVLPHVQQRLVMFLMESRERLDDIRKWRTRRRWHDGGGVPASFPGFRHHCNNVRTKEGSGQGWLVETRVVLLSDQLKQVRTLRVLCTSTLSVASAITLCVRSGCLSRHRPWARVSTPSLHELPFHGVFYPVSTPITAIRHRCSSFCTWPTYLPLSPESFSCCRLRWTTPPSPQSCFVKKSIIKGFHA